MCVTYPKFSMSLVGCLVGYVWYYMCYGVMCAIKIIQEKRFENQSFAVCPIT